MSTMTPNPRRDTPRCGSASAWWLIALVIGLGAGAAVVAVITTRPYGDDGSGLDERFEYRLDDQQRIPPELIGYRQAETVRLAMRQPRAIAVDAVGRWYVAGDRAVQRLDSNGRMERKIILDREPTCVGVDPAVGSISSSGSDSDEAAAESAATRVFVGLGDHIEVYDATGDPVATWPSRGERALLTAVAAGPEGIFVADAGNRIVRRCDVEGNILLEIGQRPPALGEAASTGQLAASNRTRPSGAKSAGGVFIIPSPYFDLALGRDGLLRVVNPGGHRIEVYTADGRFEEPLMWGKAGTAVDRFCGCCNPAAIALMSDRRMVTSEKGIPRVKIYSADGQFETVVASPEMLGVRAGALDETREDHRLPVFDVAVDREDRVLVLDPMKRLVQVFVPK